MVVASNVHTEATAANVDHPLMLLQPHPGLMSWDDPTCATRLYVTEKPYPLRFTEGMGGVDMFATTKLACKRISRHYHHYLTENTADWYLFGFLRVLPVIGTQLMGWGA
jgi:hypothetical protein